MRAKIIKLGAGILGFILLLIPFFTHNHIYQHVALGGDTQFFIKFINDATKGVPLTELWSKAIYPGEALTLWILGLVNKVLHVNPADLFFIYTLLVIVAVAVTLYYFGKYFGGSRTGWLVMVLGLLCTQSILGLYSYACILNIINMYVVLLWAIILMGRWYIGRKLIYLILGVVLIGIFSVLHVTAFYLPYAIVVMIMVLAILRWRKKIEWRHFYLYGGIVLAILAVSIIVPIVTQWGQLADKTQTITSAFRSFWDVKRYADCLFIFFMQDLTPISTIIGVLVVAGLWHVRHSLQINKKISYMLVVLGSFVIALIVGSVLVQPLSLKG